MQSPISREKTVPIRIKPQLALALLFCARLAAAQNNLGELLDAGARRLSPDEFKQEVVQHVLIGLTGSGSNLEVIYTANGLISGKGTYIATAVTAGADLDGEWKIDDSGKICTSMRLRGPGLAASSGVLVLPPRCQFWFKYNERYFIADSDSDRSARVLRRTRKQ